MPDGTCSVDGCAKKLHCRGLCPMHYQRRRIHGDLGPAGMTRQKNEGSCTVEGCDQPMRKTGWCASHYAQWKRAGEVKPFGYKWRNRRVCDQCGAKDWPPNRRRRFCTAACQQAWRRHNGLVKPGRPKTRRAKQIWLRAREWTTCVRCKIRIDLSVIGNGGRRKRIDTKLCRQCKRIHSKQWMTAGEVALRDGTDCRLCGSPVDMTASHPDPMRASVDHIIPRARGGSDNPENLQLSHLLCNQRKSDRMPA